jgi:GTP 3',8-cyclase
LLDSFGRRVTDLRLSVTDRCNMRCRYCMPEEGMKWLPRTELLSFEEIERVARLCVSRFGVESIRLTGGEPTVRAHLTTLVAMLAQLRVPGSGKPVDLAMTTNGANLALIADDLRRAGLERLNVSLDSLQKDRFASLTGRDALESVLSGIASARQAGFSSIKVNVVTMRGVNEDEAVDFAAFGRSSGVEPRFIEMMPLDAQGAWTPQQVVSAEETVAAITSVFPAALYPNRGAEPAQRYRYLDGKGSFGVIASVTRPFCDSCDRMRLTADGQVRTCLFSLAELDLRSLMRNGACDDELATAIAAAVFAKPAGHRIGRIDFIRPARGMSQIGG